MHAEASYPESTADRDLHVAVLDSKPEVLHEPYALQKIVSPKLQSCVVLTYSILELSRLVGSGNGEVEFPQKL